MIDQNAEARILDAFRPTFDRAAEGAARVASQEWRGVIGRSVPAGRTYRDRHGRRRRASAPGQPPADPTGALREAIVEAPAQRDGGRSRSASFSKSGIAGILEYGDPPQAPRPSARPGFALAGEKLRADLGQVLR